MPLAACEELSKLQRWCDEISEMLEWYPKKYHALRHPHCTCDTIRNQNFFKRRCHLPDLCWRRLSATREILMPSSLDWIGSRCWRRLRHRFGHWLGHWFRCQLSVQASSWFGGQSTSQSGSRLKHRFSVVAGVNQDLTASKFLELRTNCTNTGHANDIACLVGFEYRNVSSFPVWSVRPVTIAG